MFTRSRIESAIAAGKLSPAARSMDPESTLDQYAGANGLSRNEALAELAPPRYWVLPHRGYPDTMGDYIPAENRAEVFATLTDLGWLDNPGCYVFAGERTPWEERAMDPYPDWVAERGPRGGYRWERA